MKVDFYSNKRFALGTLYIFFVSTFQQALISAQSPDRITLQCIDIKSAAIEHNTQGIYQKRHISLVDIDTGIAT